MAVKPYDEYTKVTICTAIANKAAPTIAELTAGTDISKFVVKDGLETPATQNTIKTATLVNRYDAEIPGTYGGPVKLTCVRDAVTADDDAWDLFELDLVVFTVVRRMVLHSTAWTAAQKVEVYPGVCGQKLMAKTAENEPQRFEVTIFGNLEPALEASVAA
jgi:hypothetical protein